MVEFATISTQLRVWVRDGDIDDEVIRCKAGRGTSACRDARGRRSGGRTARSAKQGR